MQWYIFLNVHSAKILFLLCSEDRSTLHVTCGLYMKVKPDCDPVVLSKFDNSRYIVWTSRSVAT